MAALIRIMPPAVIKPYERAPKAGQLTGPHALLGPVLTVATCPVDALVEACWFEDRHSPLDNGGPRNPLAHLLAGRAVHGDCVLHRPDGLPLTGGQIETFRAVARVLDSFGWDRALQLCRRYRHQDLRRRSTGGAQ